MQYKVPQNVQREDRIIGPITMKQLIICVVGFGMAYATYVFLAKKYTIEIWLIPTAFWVILTAAFAFLKINNIPFTKWILLLIEFFLSPRRRVWQKGADTIHTVTIAKPIQTPKKKTPTQAEKKASKQNISRISNMLDNYSYEHVKTKKHPKLDNVDDKNLLHEAFLDHSPHTTERHDSLAETAATMKAAKLKAQKEKALAEKKAQEEKIKEKKAQIEKCLAEKAALEIKKAEEEKAKRAEEAKKKEVEKALAEKKVQEEKIKREEEEIKRKLAEQAALEIKKAEEEKAKRAEEAKNIAEKALAEKKVQEEKIKENTQPKPERKPVVSPAFTQIKKTNPTKIQKPTTKTKSNKNIEIHHEEIIKGGEITF